jgi:ABC-type branched-subunit amino acid transport system ATPase component
VTARRVGRIGPGLVLALAASTTVSACSKGAAPVTRLGLVAGAALAAVSVLAGMALARLRRGGTDAPRPTLGARVDHSAAPAAAAGPGFRPRPVPAALLACQGVDFSYGGVQVLFGVDFAVGEGEAIALVGTNGAGKSTLLRVASGLATPKAGRVLFDGRDITGLGPERRAALGIVHVIGGRGVFGPLTVAENLRVAGYSLGRSRRTVESGIEASFAAFPRLAERRDQPAASLSGGEQQMLALSRALVVRPRLLLIDELSLGLAPRVVADLLALVGRINSAGAAVVLVEQSVAVAARAVRHAYFMEKGEIRFDGRAEDLLHRADLLRSVFLDGAAAALQAAP